MMYKSSQIVIAIFIFRIFKFTDTKMVKASRKTITELVKLNGLVSGSRHLLQACSALGSSVIGGFTYSKHSKPQFDRKETGAMHTRGKCDRAYNVLTPGPYNTIPGPKPLPLVGNVFLFTKWGKSNECQLTYLGRFDRIQNSQT